MMRWSCHGLHGCVPVAPSRDAERVGELEQLGRRSPTRAAASANVSQRPVRTSTSEAISSPTRCSSSSVPCAAACSSSKRLRERERLRIEDRELLLDREREVLPSSNASRALASSLLPALRSPMKRERYSNGSSRRCATLSHYQRSTRRARAAAPSPSPLVGGERQQLPELLPQLHGVALRERGELAVPRRTPPRGPRRPPPGPSAARRAAGSRTAAASAATIPNASGKIDGTTVTSASGIRWTRWRCSSGP